MRESGGGTEGGSGKRNVEGPRPRRLQHTEPCRDGAAAHARARTRHCDASVGDRLGVCLQQRMEVSHGQQKLFP